MPVSKAQRITFQRMILDWWQLHARDLPWRKTRDPYKILVSEVMLQQTQVARVLPKYDEFLKLFPDVFALAKASPAQVLQAWKGMGYNRRALYLKRTAQEVARTWKGKFPETEEELRKLPGLGKYTARALMVFAFEKDVAMIDTNIRQIITHFFYKGLPQKENIIQETADALVPAGKSWEWHQALMDYGALELPRIQPRKKHTHPRTVTSFKESDRFFRGRVMDELRESDMDDKRLMKWFADTYGKDTEFSERILTGLMKDGLVVRTGSRFHLPT